MALVLPAYWGLLLGTLIRKEYTIIGDDRESQRERGTETETDGVFQMPWTPAYGVASGEMSQLSCGISRRLAPFWSASLGILRVDRVQWGHSTTTMAAPIKRFIFFVFVPRWSFEC